jgi:hypothetical protein
MCTLYKGVPHGIALINYTDPKYNWDSFRGVGVFHHGKLHNTPFSFLDENGYAFSYTKMHNGRPADASYCTYFWPNWYTQPVDSLKAGIDISGW